MVTKADITLADLLSRKMETADLPEVLQIERNVQPIPWSRLSFEESLTKQEESLTKQEESLTHKKESLTLTTNSAQPNSLMHNSRVICSADAVVGFHITSSILDEFHILNLAVAPQYHGLGLGHFLMQDILKLVEQSAVKKIFLEVRSSNVVAQGLYRKWQFKQVALRKNYYRTPNSERENALVFIRTARPETGLV